MAGFLRLASHLTGFGPSVRSAKLGGFIFRASSSVGHFFVRALYGVEGSHSILFFQASLLSHVFVLSCGCVLRCVGSLCMGDR